MKDKIIRDYIDDNFIAYLVGDKHLLTVSQSMSEETTDENGETYVTDRYNDTGFYTEGNKIYRFSPSYDEEWQVDINSLQKYPFKVGE